MLKSYKYRIYPTGDQKELMAKIFGQVRFVYNLGLETKIKAYSGNRINIDCFKLMKQIKELKDTDCPWLKESPSQSLQALLEIWIMLILISFAVEDFLNLKINIINSLSNYLREYF